MRINIELDTGSATDLAALTALVMVLRGDTSEDIGSPIPAAAPAPPAPPAATGAPPPPPASESLIEAEAARVTTAPPPPPSDAAPAVDSSGLPYDERIHSSTRAINQDKTWRNKRGVDPALLASVTAELRARTAPPAPEPTPEAAFSPPQQGDAPPAPPVPPPVEQQPPAPPAPPADAPPAGLTYAAIIKACNDAGKTYDELNGLAVMLGLDKFQSLVKRPDLFESFMASIG